MGRRREEGRKNEGREKMRRVLPDVATSNPGGGTSKPLQLRIFRKSRVVEDLTLREVPVLPKNACSRLPKVPLQGFCSTPARFRYCFFCNWRVLFHLCLPLILLLFPGCGLWEGGLPDHIIARIDREEVTVDEFNRYSLAGGFGFCCMRFWIFIIGRKNVGNFGNKKTTPPFWRPL